MGTPAVQAAQLDHVQPSPQGCAVLAWVFGKKVVDGLSASGPEVVIVDGHDATGYQPGSHSIQAGPDRVVPITVDVGLRHPFVSHDGVLEQARDQSDVVGIHIQVESGERVAHLVHPVKCAHG